MMAASLTIHNQNWAEEECLGGSAVEHLSLAQGMIPGFQDQVLHRALCGGPASPSAYVYVSASLSLCLA